VEWLELVGQLLERLELERFELVGQWMARSELGPPRMNNLSDNRCPGASWG
jgi:hypothetical protein